VVETGQDLEVASMSHEAEAVRAHVKARSWTPALPLKTVREMIPFLMVPATLEPTRTAPRNSHRPAAIQAWRRVREREATEVAKELRISLMSLAGVSCRFL
jgi:hypothetical protein